jgi:hypothetical protein
MPQPPESASSGDPKKPSTAWQEGEKGKVVDGSPAQTPEPGKVAEGKIVTTPETASQSDAPPAAETSPEKKAEPDAKKPRLEQEELAVVPGAVTEEAAPPLPVTAVDIDEEAFTAFVERMNQVQRETFMCTWADIAEVKGLCGEEESMMKGFRAWWLGKPDAASADALVVACERAGAKVPVGLILCLGVVKPEKITAVVDAARAEILRSMPVGMVRLTMWYRDEANEFKLDKDTEDAIKACQPPWKWFQLTNTDDGKRGQVMQTRRFPPPDGPDPALPEA